MISSNTVSCESDDVWQIRLSHLFLKYEPPSGIQYTGCYLYNAIKIYTVPVIGIKPVFFPSKIILESPLLEIFQIFLYIVSDGYSKTYTQDQCIHK